MYGKMCILHGLLLFILGFPLKRKRDSHSQLPHNYVCVTCTSRCTSTSNVPAKESASAKCEDALPKNLITATSCLVLGDVIGWPVSFTRHAKAGYFFRVKVYFIRVNKHLHLQNFFSNGKFLLQHISNIVEYSNIKNKGVWGGNR